MSRRGWAIAISFAWVASLGWLVKREFFRTTSERLAEAALAASPGTAFYRLDLAGQQIGFASTTLDTASTTLQVSELLLLELPTADGLRRTRARSVALVNRALGLERLDEDFDGPDGAFRAQGIVGSDSTLALTLTSAGPGLGRDSQALRVRLPHQIVLPILLPLRLAFGGAGALKPGRAFSVRVFDPFELAERDVTVTVGAESTLVVPDSAGFDSTTMTWTVAHLDTVRAFRIDESSRGATTRAWIDAQGRLVRQTGPTGFTLERSPYEMAYHNFRHRDTTRLVRAEQSATGTIVPSTVLRAGIALPVPAAGATLLRARVSGVDLARWHVAGGRQRLDQDTLIVERETGAALVPGYTLPARDPALLPWVASEILIQSDAPGVRGMARALVRGERDPARAAELLTHWVFREVRREPTLRVPSALVTLNRRTGDCNDVTVLYVALARAVGLPARPVAGLLRVGRRFYYHAWPEVFLGGWVAVDPLLDQFPADAGHVRVLTNGLARQSELLRFLGRLRVDVL